MRRQNSPKTNLNFKKQHFFLTSVRERLKKNTVLGNMFLRGGVGGGGSEPIPSALSEKSRDFATEGGGG